MFFVLLILMQSVQNVPMIGMHTESFVRTKISGIVKDLLLLDSSIQQEICPQDTRVLPNIERYHILIGLVLLGIACHAIYTTVFTPDRKLIRALLKDDTKVYINTHRGNHDILAMMGAFPEKKVMVVRNSPIGVYFGFWHRLLANIPRGVTILELSVVSTAIRPNTILFVDVEGLVQADDKVIATIMRHNQLVLYGGSTANISDKLLGYDWLESAMKCKTTTISVTG